METNSIKSLLGLNLRPTPQFVYAWMGFIISIILAGLTFVNPLTNVASYLFGLLALIFATLVVISFFRLFIRVGTGS